jgi:hypothetical protein
MTIHGILKNFNKRKNPNQGGGKFFFDACKTSQRSSRSADGAPRNLQISGLMRRRQQILPRRVEESPDKLGEKKSGTVSAELSTARGN